MSAPTLLHTYRVILTAWTAHKAFIEARSSAEAEELAKTLWQADAGAFKDQDGGIEGITVELIAGEAAR